MKTQELEQLHLENLLLKLHQLKDKLIQQRTAFALYILLHEYIQNWIQHMGIHVNPTIMDSAQLNSCKIGSISETRSLLTLKFWLLALQLITFLHWTLIDLLHTYICINGYIWNQVYGIIIHMPSPDHRVGTKQD